MPDKRPFVGRTKPETPAFAEPIYNKKTILESHKDQGTAFMSFGIRLHVWGERACFTRPEMKAERVSYDVITPSAARGILEAIHWKPAIRWHIDRIHVLRPIRFETLRRNEVGSKASSDSAGSAMKRGKVENLALYVDEERQQRAMTFLKDVAYVIEAHLELTPRAGEEETAVKHLEMFKRRARNGQCFHAPCLGVREFPAFFALVEDDDQLPTSALNDEDLDRNLGWMLHDIDFAHGSTPRFFPAKLEQGCVNVPAWHSEEIKS